VAIDGVLVGQTTATSLRVAQPVSQGPHTWQVTAVNQVGLATVARPSTLFVDSVAPVVQLRLKGAQRAGSALHLYVRYSDAPPPLSAATASGVTTVRVRWGDGATSQIRHGALHTYRSAGRYRMTVTVSDRAGNSTTLVRRLRITPPGR
jgi:hypothetical protein